MSERYSHLKSKSHKEFEKSNEKDVLSVIYDLSIKLFDVMKYYPDMKNKRIIYHEIFLSVIGHLNGL